MVVQPAAEIAQVLLPEGMAGLTQPGRQLALVQLLHPRVQALAKQRPYILKVETPADHYGAQ